MNKTEYFLDLVKAALPAIIARQIPSPGGAANLAADYAAAVLEHDLVKAVLEKLTAEQAKQAAVYTPPSPKPGTNKRG